MPIFEIDLVRQLRNQTVELLAKVDERIAQLETEVVAPMPLMSVSNICIYEPETGRLLDDAKHLGEWAENHEEIYDENAGEDMRNDDDPAHVVVDGKKYTWAELKKAWEDDRAYDRQTQEMERKEQEARGDLRDMTLYKAIKCLGWNHVAPNA